MKKLYDYTEDMICYKESLGYARRTYEGFLNDFARFVKKNYPDAESLTEDIALEWCQQPESENPSGYHRKVATFRELTKYLYAIGSGVYILPADYTARPERYTPYIFTDQELIDFFHASDQVLPCKSSPSRSFIIPVIYRLIYFCGLWSDIIKVQSQTAREKGNYRKKTAFINFYSQFAPAGWYKKYTETPITDAILDRIVHDSYTIVNQHTNKENDKSMREVYGLDSVKHKLTHKWFPFRNHWNFYPVRLEPIAGHHGSFNRYI